MKLRKEVERRRGHEGVARAGCSGNETRRVRAEEIYMAEKLQLEKASASCQNPDEAHKSTKGRSDQSD